MTTIEPCKDTNWSSSFLARDSMLSTWNIFWFASLPQACFAPNMQTATVWQIKCRPTLMPAHQTALAGQLVKHEEFTNNNNQCCTTSEHTATKREYCHGVELMPIGTLHVLLYLYHTWTWEQLGTVMQWLRKQHTTTNKIPKVRSVSRSHPLTHAFSMSCSRVFCSVHRPPHLSSSFGC